MSLEKGFQRLEKEKQRFKVHFTHLYLLISNRKK